MDTNIKRDLDGYYFRINRDGKVDNLCWSDMTEEERFRAIERFDKAALRRFCIGLGTVIRQIGDELDLVCKME